MSAKTGNKRTIRWQYLLVALSILFVLLSSCYVKSGLKDVLGMPVKTGQVSTLKNNTFISGSSDDCLITTFSETGFVHNLANQAQGNFPLVLVASIFIFLFGISFSTVQPHPLYRSVKIPGSLSLFLQYRKLII